MITDKTHWAFVEIASLADNPNPLLPGYSNKISYVDEVEVEGEPWTWQEWCDQPHKAATFRGGKIYIGAATFASRSLTADEHLALTEAGVVLIHPDDLPAESVK